jgi:hypothetical protein
MMVSESDV